MDSQDLLQHRSSGTYFTLTWLSFHPQSFYLYFPFLSSVIWNFGGFFALLSFSLNKNPWVLCSCSFFEIDGRSVWFSHFLDEYYFLGPYEFFFFFSFRVFWMCLFAMFCFASCCASIRRRWWHPIPVLLPGKSRGQRTLVGCSLWGRTRLSDFTFTFHFHALEKEMATHSRVLALRIPGTEQPGGLPSMGSQRVRYDWSDLAAAAAAAAAAAILSIIAAVKTRNSSVHSDFLMVQRLRLYFHCRGPNFNPWSGN